MDYTRKDASMDCRAASIKLFTTGFQELLEALTNISSESDSLDEFCTEESGFNIFHLFVYAKYVQRHDTPATREIFNDDGLLVEFAQLCRLARELDNAFDTKKALELISGHKLLEQPDGYGLTPIHYAAITNDDSAIFMLTKLLASPTITSLLTVEDSNGWTAVHWAAAKSSLKSLACILYIISEDDDHIISIFSARDDQGRTPLHIALLQQDASAAKCIIEAMKNASAPVNWITSEKDAEGISHLHYSVRSKSLDLVKLLLEAIDSESVLEKLKEPSKCNKTALHWLYTKFNNVDLIEEQPFAAGLFSHKDEKTLTTKVENSDEALRILEFLLQFSDASNIFPLYALQDDQFNTVLHLAVKSGLFSSVELLMSKLDCRLRAGFLHSQDSNKETALHCAARINSTKMIQILLYSIDVDDRLRLLTMQDFRHWTVLHRAVASESFNVVRAILHAVHPGEVLALLKYATKNDGDMHCFSNAAPLHLAAVNNRTKMLIFVLNSLKPLYGSEEIYSLLRTQDIKGMSVLHFAAIYCCSEVIDLIMGLINQEHFDLLTKLRSGYEKKTPLHFIMHDHPVSVDTSSNMSSDKNDVSQTECLKTFLDSLEPTKKTKLLKAVTANGKTVLHQAVESHSLSSIKLILNSHEYDDCLELITIQDKEGRTAIHLAAEKEFTEALQIILQSVEKKHRLSITSLQNSEGLTALHCSAKGNCKQSISTILQLLNHHDRLKMSSIKSGKNSAGENTALHVAIKSGHNDLVAPLLAQLTRNQKYELLEISDIEGYPAIFYLMNVVPSEATEAKTSSEVLDYIIKDLSAVQIAELLLKNEVYEYDLKTIHNCIGGYFFQKFFEEHMAEKDKDSHNKWIGSENSHKFLQQICAYTCGVHDENIIKFFTILPEKQRDRLASEENIDSYIFHGASKSTGPSTKLMAFFQWSKSQKGCYYLPSPPSILIMYSTEEREGAKEEMNALSTMFTSFALEPEIKQDLTEREMMLAIRAAQEPENVSALIVIIMSHGEQGRICAKDKTVEIQSILRQMVSPSLEGKPKILVVQACQTKPFMMSADMTKTDASFRTDPVPASSQYRPALVGRSNSESGSTDRRSSGVKRDSFHVEQRDVALMLATVEGGLAVRNLMIPVFAKILQDSAEDAGIHDVFLKTNQEIEDQHPDQVPIQTSTMTKKLCLKKVFPGERKGGVCEDEAAAGDDSPTTASAKYRRTCLVM